MSMLPIGLDKITIAATTTMMHRLFSPYDIKMKVVVGATAIGF